MFFVVAKVQPKFHIRAPRAPSISALRAKIGQGEARIRARRAVAGADFQAAPCAGKGFRYMCVGPRFLLRQASPSSPSGRERSSYAGAACRELHRVFGEARFTRRRLHSALREARFGESCHFPLCLKPDSREEGSTRNGKGLPVAGETFPEYFLGLSPASYGLFAPLADSKFAKIYGRVLARTVFCRTFAPAIGSLQRCRAPKGTRHALCD